MSVLRDFAVSMSLLWSCVMLGAFGLWSVESLAEVYDSPLERSLLLAAAMLAAISVYCLAWRLLAWARRQKGCLHRTLLPSLVYRGEGRWTTAETARCAACGEKVRLPTDDFRLGRKR